MTNKINEAVQQSSISTSCCLSKKAHALLLSINDMSTLVSMGEPMLKELVKTLLLFAAMLKNYTFNSEHCFSSSMKYMHV